MAEEEIFSVSADASGFQGAAQQIQGALDGIQGSSDQALSALQELGQAGDQAATALQGTDSSAEGAGSSLGVTGANAEHASGSLSGVEKASTLAHEGLNAAAGAASALGAGLGEVGSMGGEAAKVLENIAKGGDQATMALVAFAVAVGGAAFALTSQFDDATVNLQNFGGLTREQADEIANAFLQMAHKSEFSVSEMLGAIAPVAGRLELLTGHALDTATATQIMSAAGNLAEVSHTKLSGATDALVKTMLAYKIPASEAARASDTLWNTSRLTGMGVEELAGSLGRLHSRLGVAAPDLEDTSALIADLGAQGVEGSRGIMVVTSAFSTLLGGSKSVDEELKRLGVTVFDESGKFVGMRSVIEQLGPKLAGMSDAQRKAAEDTLFGAGAAGVLDSILTGGVSTFDTYRKKVDEAGTAAKGAAADDAEWSVILEENLHRVQAFLIEGAQPVVAWMKEHWPEIQATFEAFGHVVKLVFDTWIRPVFDGLKVLLDIFSGDWSKAWEDTKTMFKNAVMAWVDFANNAKDDLLNLFNGLWTELKTVFGDGFTWLTEHWRGIPEDLWNAVKEGWKRLTEIGSTIMAKVKDGLDEGWPKITAWFRGIPGALGYVMDEIWEGITKIGERIIDGVVEGIRRAAHWIADEVIKAISAVPGGSLVLGALGKAGQVAGAVASGGQAAWNFVTGNAEGLWEVPGPRGAGDIYPSLLSPGEMVIPERFADALRNGAGFGTGGRGGNSYSIELHYHGTPEENARQTRQVLEQLIQDEWYHGMSVGMRAAGA